MLRYVAAVVESDFLGIHMVETGRVSTDCLFRSYPQDLKRTFHLGPESFEVSSVSTCMRARQKITGGEGFSHSHPEIPRFQISRWLCMILFTLYFLPPGSLIFLTTEGDPASSRARTIPVLPSFIPSNTSFT